jgi:hypothetical protein
VALRSLVIARVRAVVLRDHTKTDDFPERQNVLDLLVLACIGVRVVGELQRACDLMDRLLVGLYAEDSDPEIGAPGELPRGRSDLALIDAAAP